MNPTQKEKLQKEILRLTSEGYHVLTQTEDSAQLKREKKFRIGWSLFWAFITIPFGGIGFVAYVGYYFIIKKDDFKFVNFESIENESNTQDSPKKKKSKPTETPPKSQEVDSQESVESDKSEAPSTPVEVEESHETEETTKSSIIEEI